jgi:hypothetical protein
MEFSQKTIITGIIMPYNWDENGRIIEIALYTNNEEVYPLEHNSLTRELMNLVHKRVEIKGKTSEHPDGRKTITAHNYNPLKEFLNDK